MLACPLLGCRPAAPPLTQSEVDTAIATAKPQLPYHDHAMKKDAIAYEATKWVTTNGNFAPFASNRFRTRADAVKYIRNLYRLGAIGVYAVQILDEPERIKTEGGPYSDSLDVYLPADKARRRALFEIESKEAKAQGFVGIGEEGQEKIFLWLHH
jgi:hypothetical protein